MGVKSIPSAACVVSSLLAVIAATLVEGQARAADPAQLDQVQLLQQEFFGSNGAVVPDEVTLAPFSGSLLLEAQFALIDQATGVGNSARIEQSGVGNVSAVLQGFGDDNAATVKQLGNSNYATVAQSGYSNHADGVTQQGDSNWVAIAQTGVANSIAGLSQIGNNNRATVNQYSGANALSLAQTYDYNQVAIDQYGGTSLDVAQTNAGGSATSINSLTIKAYAQVGSDPNFGPIRVDGAGQLSMTLCNPAGSAFCAQYVH